MITALLATCLFFAASGGGLAIIGWLQMKGYIR